MSHQVISSVDRLIPAGAGSTAHKENPEAFEAAHPRRRGEHEPADQREPCDPGSSPQARGALSGVWDAPVGTGLIPAGAGSTSG